MYTTSIAAVAATLFANTLAMPLIVHPEPIDDIVISADNTFNSTLIGTNSTSPTNSSTSAVLKGFEDAVAAGNAVLPCSFVNNYESASINVYINGQDPNNDNAWVFVLADGSFYYPPATDSATPVTFAQDVAIPLGAYGTTLDLTVPGYLSSGRIYAAAGTLDFETVINGGLVVPSATNPDDPSADIDWGFTEFTNSDGGIYYDVSYIDVVGIPLGIGLTGADGTQTVPGISSDTVADVCSALTAQSAIDGQPWNELCYESTEGVPLRIISPGDYISIDATAFEDYFTSYVESVWTYYTTNALIIDTQESYGNVTCGVVGANITCEGGDSWGYAQPTANDIFGCNTGPFENAGNALHLAIVPRLCAAFNRGTLLLDGGNVQPSLDPTYYYTADAPYNYFSKFVHEYEIDGIGYAFPYDDVAPDGVAAVSGTITDPTPTSFTMVIGGPST